MDNNFKITQSLQLVNPALWVTESLHHFLYVTYLVVPTMRAIWNVSRHWYLHYFRYLIFLVSIIRENFSNPHGLLFGAAPCENYSQWELYSHSRPFAALHKKGVILVDTTTKKFNSESTPLLVPVKRAHRQITLSPSISRGYSGGGNM